MKNYLFIFLLIFTGLAARAQDNSENDKVGKIRDRMNEYIQNKLGLSKKEAEQFTPTFLRYFSEFNQTHRLYRADRLMFQQKIIDLRLRYRNEFKQIMDEQRANKVYVYEDEFRRKAIQILEDRRDRLGEKAIRRDRSLLQ
jgi:hypothetical protein